MNATCIEHPYEAPTGRVSDFRQDLACAAQSDVRILITGNDGVGKRSVAKAVHRWSRRRRAPFLTIDCAATSDALLESKLFGRAACAEGITGSTRGCLERADGGTLFMANIGAMSVRLQARLLQFLESGEIRRVGDGVRTTVDVRVIAGTDWNLLAHRSDIRFREDLFYRLNVMHLVIPALRQPGC
jgi:DNA-binding NtrC family response regulator